MLAVRLVLALAVMQPATQAPQPPLPASQQYRVGPNDVLKISVVGETELSKNYRVEADGSIFVPYLNERVPVADKTVLEIEQVLKNKLSPAFILNPQVAVEVDQYRSRNIHVIGEVKMPGLFTITGEYRLLDAIAHAHGFSADAGDEILVRRVKDPSSKTDDDVELIRIRREDLETGPRLYNILLQDEDTINVLAAPKFCIQGQVKSPGCFKIEKNMTVNQAVIRAGGLTDRGSWRNLKVRRRDPKTGMIRERNIKRDDLVQEGDEINVGARKF